MARPPKGTPTDTNLWALAHVFGDRREVPNQLEKTDVPHIRRCLDAGLLTVDRARKVLTLTPAGVEAAQRERARASRVKGGGATVVPSVELSRALGLTPGAPITAKQLDLKVEAHTTSASVPSEDLRAQRLWKVKSLSSTTPGSPAYASWEKAIHEFDAAHPEVAAYEHGMLTTRPAEVGGYRLQARVIHPNMGFGTVVDLLPRTPDRPYQNLVVEFDTKKPGMPKQSVLHPDRVFLAPDERTYDRAALLREWWRLEKAERAEMRAASDAGTFGGPRPARAAFEAFGKAHPEIREAGLDEMSEQEEAQMGRKLRAAARRGEF